MNLKVLSRGVRRRSAMLLLVVALMAALVPTAAFASTSSYTPASSQRYYHRPTQRPAHYQHKPHWSCATTYRVKKGDTLSKISRYFHVPVMKLAKANGIKNIHRIYAGQHLCIPH
jgi:LysM repeat protein